MALYLPDHNGLFLDCPETGGEIVAATLRDALGIRVEDVGYQHSHKDLVGPLRSREQPATFALVRHPVSWYASYWEHQAQDRRAGGGSAAAESEPHWHPNWRLDRMHDGLNFEEFIRTATAASDRLYELFDWYTGLGTRDEVDVIGKYETVITDLIRFLELIGVPYEGPALRALAPASTDVEEPPAPWTTELRALVIAAESRCLQDYGYDENEPISGPAGTPAIRAPIPPTARYEAKPWQPLATASRRRPVGAAPAESSASHSLAATFRHLRRRLRRGSV